MIQEEEHLGPLDSLRGCRQLSIGRPLGSLTQVDKRGSVPAVWLSQSRFPVLGAWRVALIESLFGQGRKQVEAGMMADPAKPVFAVAVVGLSAVHDAVPVVAVDVLTFAFDALGSVVTFVEVVVDLKQASEQSFDFARISFAVEIRLRVQLAEKMRQPPAAASRMSWSEFGQNDIRVRQWRVVCCCV